MKCPKCKSPELKPKTDNNLYPCPKCGGLWLEGYSKGLLHELNTFTTGGCIFHTIPDTDSTGIWTVIPFHSGHRFHFNLDSDSI